MPVATAVDLEQALNFVRSHRQAVLTTIRGNGRPQLSNVLYLVGDDGVVQVSITADRAKYANLRREPWAALHVSREDFFAYVVLEGAVELTPVSAAVDDATVEALVELYRGLVGEHPDWDAYRQAMIDERRVVLQLTPTRAYGMLQLPPASGT